MPLQACFYAIFRQKEQFLHRCSQRFRHLESQYRRRNEDTIFHGIHRLPRDSDLSRELLLRQIPPNTIFLEPVLQTIACFSHGVFFYSRSRQRKLPANERQATIRIKELIAVG